MKMTFRWYGRESDPIPLKYVKQIPGMSGLSGMPQYQTLLRENRRSMPQVWQGYRPEKDTEGQKILWLYRQPGVRFHGMAETFQ